MSCIGRFLRPGFYETHDKPGRTKENAISADLEAIEQDIDREHLRNVLTDLRFSEAAWRFLAFCEEEHLKFMGNSRSATRQQLACFADDIVNSMKTPLRWLWRRCHPGTRLARHYTGRHYQASWDFINLAREYDLFERAYIYARAGAIAIVLQGDTIVPTGTFRDDTRFEAYDRLCEVVESGTRLPALRVLRDVAETVTVDGEQFHYKIDSATVTRGMEELSPLLEAQHWLPPSWALARYSLGAFRSISSALRVRALLHFVARVEAAQRGCVGRGYTNSVLLFDNSRLLRWLKKCTGLDESVIRAIVRDLTFGEHGVNNPDPALQPLIPLTPALTAISPVLVMGSNMERNLTVLVNRFPDERDAYSRLSTKRESISRDKMKVQLECRGFRFQSVQIPGRRDLPDVDLAIIDDVGATCLVLELKAFVAPAEPREVLEKAEEIERGVRQIKKLRSALQLNPHLFAGPLGITDRYSICFAVASETCVGTANVQDESVPVVRIAHLVRRILAATSLSDVCLWLSRREYLPVEGRHYEVRDVVAAVGSWRITWYGIKPLIRGEYL